MKKILLIVAGAILVLISVNQQLTLGNQTQKTSVEAVVTQQILPTATPTLTPTPTSGLSNNNYYINSNGNTIHSPAYSNTVPAGATARCRDGTYSFSQHRRGTCSYHGGVAEWL